MVFCHEEARINTNNFGHRGHRGKKVYQVNRVSGCGYQDIRVSGCWTSGEQGYPPARAQVSEIVHAPNLKNKIGAGSPCTIRCRVYAHSELEKFWRESEPIQREKSETAQAGSRDPKYLVFLFNSLLVFDWLSQNKNTKNEQKGTNQIYGLPELS